MVRNWMRFMTIWLDIKLNIVSIMTALRNKLTNCRLITLLNVRRQVFIYKGFVLCVYVSPPKTIFIHFIHKCSSAFFSFPFFIILSPITYFIPSLLLTYSHLSNYQITDIFLFWLYLFVTKIAFLSILLVILL